jgi:hypothetical protein
MQLTVTELLRSNLLPHLTAVLAVNQCPLSGVKQTLQIRPAMSAFDPKRTWASQDFCSANWVLLSAFLKVIRL